MFVGEQPGDREDITGRPFVGAAGTLLDQALEQVGIDRAEIYVTNVVKHFKWVPQERGTTSNPQEGLADSEITCVAVPGWTPRSRWSNRVFWFVWGATAAQALAREGLPRQ